MPRGSTVAWAAAIGSVSLFAGTAGAQLEIGNWGLDPLVGASEYELNIQIDCVGALFCLFINGYDSTRISPVTGGGGASLVPGGSFLVHARTSRRLWSLPVADATYDPIFGVGTPEVTHARLLFRNLQPLDVPGLVLAPFGPGPISGSVEVGMEFDFTLGVNDSQANVFPPLPVEFTGQLEMLDSTRFEIQGLETTFGGSLSFPVQTATVTVTTAGRITLHMSGELAPAPVPLGPAVAGGTTLALAVCGALAASRRGRR